MLIEGPSGRFREVTKLWWSLFFCLVSAHFFLTTKNSPRWRIVKQETCFEQETVLKQETIWTSGNCFGNCFLNRKQILGNRKLLFLYILGAVAVFMVWRKTVKHRE